MTSSWSRRAPAAGEHRGPTARQILIVFSERVSPVRGAVKLLDATGSKVSTTDAVAWPERRNRRLAVRPTSALHNYSGLAGDIRRHPSRRGLRFQRRRCNRARHGGGCPPASRERRSQPRYWL